MAVTRPAIPPPAIRTRTAKPSLSREIDPHQPGCTGRNASREPNALVVEGHGRAVAENGGGALWRVDAEASSIRQGDFVARTGPRLPSDGASRIELVDETDDCDAAIDGN